MPTESPEGLVQLLSPTWVLDTGSGQIGIGPYSQIPTENQLVNNRHQFEMRLKDRVCAGIFPLWKARNGVVEGVQYIAHFNPLRSCSHRVITAVHLPKTFANEIMRS